MSDHTIVIFWVIKIFLVQFFCVFLPSLLDLFCFYYVFIISVLYCDDLWMKCSFDISNFLEEISSLSPSVFFLSFFVLVIEEGFLAFPSLPLDLSI